MTLNKQAMRKKAIEAKETDDWGCDDGNFHDLATPDAVLSLLDELEAAEKRNAELTEALKQCVIGYKSCLRMGYDRIIDLGGDCDSPDVMISGNPDIHHAEKVLAAGIKIKGE